MNSLGKFIPNLEMLLRLFAAMVLVALFLFLLDNMLIYWFDFPGTRSTLIHYNFLSEPSSFKPPAENQVGYGIMHLVLSGIIILGTIIAVAMIPGRTLSKDADLYTRIAAFIVRSAFWSVFLIGIVDMVISFLRVEGLLPGIFGDHLATQLGRSVYRGTFVHFPLILISIVISFFSRTLGFIWLALLIVAAEFLDCAYPVRILL